MHGSGSRWVPRLEFGTRQSIAQQERDAQEIRHGGRNAVGHPLTLLDASGPRGALASATGLALSGDFPVAEAFCDATMSLPIHPHMGADQVQTVIAAVNETVAAPVALRA